METNSKMPGNFDRLMGMLDGLPDVAHTNASTIRVVPPLGIGGAETFILQTYRQKDEGDVIFLEVINSEGTQRIVIPPRISAVIARQRDQLTTKMRKRAAKQSADDRMARGETPAFLRKIEGGAK